MTNLTTIAKVEAYTLKDIDAAFEANVTVWIEAVSAWADIYTNRKLIADGTPSLKYYDGKGREYVPIDDAQSITAVSLGDIYGENFTTVTDYIKYPATAPHRAIILKSGVFTSGIQNVRVNADWGYLSAVPEDLAFAATVLVGGIINAQEPGAMGKRSESIGNYQVVYTDQKGLADYDRALAILDGYRRYDI